MNAAEFLKSNINASDFLRGTAADFLKVAEMPSFRKKITAERAQEIPQDISLGIGADIDVNQGRPTWVRAADFLTGHFPELKDVPEVQTVDGQLQVNVPESAEVPFLQSPEMAAGAGIAKGIGLAAPIGRKLLAGAREAAAWLTGGASEVPTMVKGGIKRAAKAVEETAVSPESLEAMVKGGKVSQLPKYAEGSAINLERLDTTQDVKQVLNALTEANREKIGKRTISWAETEKAAKDLGWTPEDLVKAGKKTAFDEAEIMAARQINANELHNLFNAIKEMPADRSLRTQEMRESILNKIYNYEEVVAATSQKSSTAGRALNIHKKMIAENPEFRADAWRKQLLDKMMDKAGVNKLTDEMIDELRNIDFTDAQAVRAIIQKYHKASLFDKIYEVWMNGLLSAPPTHFANIIGNSLTLATKIPESAISGVLRGKNPMREIVAESFGTMQGIKDGVRAAVKAFQTGIPSDMLMKVEVRHLAAIKGKKGAIVRIPTRALTAADEFFKAIVYRAELQRQAYLIAEKQGLKGQALAEEIARVINDPTQKAFFTIHKKAREESLYRTFNKPLGDLGNMVMNVRNIPWLKWLGFIAPFIRTPVNIAKFSLERTPFNFVKIARDYKLGKITADELSQELAKPVMGSLIGAATAIAVLEGNITGMPPKDKKERELLYATGWQPYSVKIGDRYYSYNRLEPIGSIMGMTADMVNESKSDAEASAKASRIILSISRNVASKTFLQGVATTLDAVSDPERYGEGWLNRFAGSAVPAVVGRAAAAADPYVREVTNPMEAVQSRLPMLSRSLPYRPELTLMTRGGVPITKPMMREGGPMMQMFSPMQISDVPPDAATYEGLLGIHRAEKKITKAKKEAMRGMLRDIRRR